MQPLPQQQHRAGAAAPAEGPHGSTNIALLERPHALTGTPTAGDICYKCHSQSVIRNESRTIDQSICATDARLSRRARISATQGNTTNNSRLINLSTTDNTPVGSGATAKLYIDTVTRKCYLVCHGESHNGRSY